MQASPRPLPSGATNRGLAGKSPAAKTPASHSHNVSTSSQPSLTPIPATNTAEEPHSLTPNPASLIANLTGPLFTPTLAGQDGLGIANIPVEGQALHPTTIRNPVAERAHRLKEIVSLLKTRVAGHGITRQGIERVAECNGFELLPDGNKTSVLGHHCVDLELTFDTVELDKVTHVELKLNKTQPQEGVETRPEDFEPQQTASELLLGNLTQPLDRDSPWGDLNDFSANLNYLGQLERLSTKVNCFGAIRGLYETFQSIWEEEKRKLTWRNDLHHVCRGAVGRTKMDSGRKLGLSVGYWRARQELGEDGEGEDSRDTSPESKTWTAQVGCEFGGPSISPSFAWIGDEILLSESVDHVENPTDHPVSIPAWKNAAPTMDDELGDDSIDKLLDTPNVRFLCTLDPPVYLPLNVLLLLNSDSQSIEIDQPKMVPYHHIVRKTGANGVAATSQLPDTAPRVVRKLLMPSPDGVSRHRSHSCTLYADQPFWCYPLDKFSFNHPKQFVDKLPFLRQYARLWQLIGNIFLLEDSVPETTQKDHPIQISTWANGITKPNGSTVKVRSNRALVKRSNREALKPRAGNNQNTGPATKPPDHDVNMDITISLDTNVNIANPSELIHSNKVRLNISIPLSNPARFFTFYVDVGLNGELSAGSTDPKWLGSGQGGMEGDGDRDREGLMKKMTRVLEISEDLGVLVEWVLEQLR